MCVPYSFRDFITQRGLVGSFCQYKVGVGRHPHLAKQGMNALSALLFLPLVASVDLSGKPLMKYQLNHFTLCPFSRKQ